jgi:hypothetical protein
MFADFEYRRAIILEGSEDSPLTLTTVGDMAKVVALALDYRGRWPTTGGIRGTQTTISGFLRLAERIRGKSLLSLLLVMLKDYQVLSRSNDWSRMTLTRGS